MKTWLFVDRESGEQFFVEEVDKVKATKTALIYFDEPHCYGEVSDEEAECLGYDTY